MASSSDIEILPPSPAKGNNTKSTQPITSTSNYARSSVDLAGRPKPRRIGVTLSNNSIREEVGGEGGKGKDSQGSNHSNNTVGSSKGKGKGKAKQEVIIIDDEDELDSFFSRAKPSVVPKRKFGANKKKQPVFSSSSPSSSSSRSASPESRIKRKPIKLPDWTHIQSGAMKNVLAKGSKPNRQKRRMSVDSESEEEKNKAGKGDKKGKGKVASKVVDLCDDSDDSLLFEEPTSKKLKKGKSVEERERSRSLTPPAPLAAFQMAQHMQSLRDNLGPERITAPLPNSSPNTRSTRANGAVRMSSPVISSTDGEDEESGEGGEEGEDDTNKVTIFVITVFDPTRINPSVRAVAAYQTPKPHRISPDSNFTRLFKSLAQTLSVSDRSTLVVTHNGRRVYAFGTPSTLNIHSEATFKCYTKDIWKASEALRLSPISEANIIPTSASTEASAATSNSQAGERELSSTSAANIATTSTTPAEVSEPVDLLKITVRGSATLVFSLAVKKTMLASQLLKQYCKKFEIVEPQRISRMWLEFDGEKLEMGKMLKDYDEIEDEETVDVREGKD